MIFPKHIPSAMRLAAMVSLSLVASLLLAGCTDGVLYEMKRMNPYYQREWKKDRELGTTFVQRVDELNLLGRQLPHMTPAEQAEWGERLERLIRNDPSPEYRAQAVRTIALIPSEASVRRAECGIHRLVGEGADHCLPVMEAGWRRKPPTCC